MFKSTIDDITITAILDKRRRAANGEWPIKTGVNRDRIRKYYPTGLTCTEDIWERLSTAKSKVLIDLREHVEISYNIIKAHVFELQTKDRFTFDNLKRSLLHYSGEFINTIFEQKIENLRKNKKIGTMETYKNSLSNIKKYGGDNIPIENITVEWLQKYEKYLLNGRSMGTIGMNMRNIRAIMNIAKSNNLIKSEQYPFGKNKYEIKSVQGRKKALTSLQIKMIANFTCEIPTLMLFRDLWLFIYTCNGINVADLLELKFNNIVDDEICFIRKKTEDTTKAIVEIRATLTNNMKKIIKRWGNEPNPDNYIFSLIEHTEDPEIYYKRKKAFIKLFNKNLKQIGAAVGIFDLTTGYARHSFATVLKRKGVNLAYISESMGHTSLNTTQIYPDSFEKEERQKNAKLLEDF